MTAPRRRLIATELSEHFDVSERRVSRGLDLPRSSLRYMPVVRDEAAALARRIEDRPGRTTLRLPTNLGPPGARGLDGQQEGGASSLPSGGAESGPTAGQSQAAPSAWTGSERLPSPALVAAKTTYGHGTLSSIVPVMVEVSSG